MFDKMKQMMELKKQAETLKRQLDDMVVDVQEVRGIRLAVTGSQTFRSVDLDEQLLKPENKSLLEEGLLRSLNAAIKKAQGVAAQQMTAVMPKF